MTMTLSEMASKLNQGITTSEKETLMTKVVITLEANVMRAAPSKTGTARRSITHEVAPGGESGRVGSNLDYIGVIVNGSAPHIIVPKNKKVLAFRAGGGQVFAKIVHHPGTRPQPFFDEGLAASLTDIERIAGEVGAQIVARLAG